MMVLIIENQRRGLFFGKKAPGLVSVGQVLRKYHGYYFAWAVIYTFWYHPVEVTPGHLIGFFYMFMLLLQGSLFFTRYHINRWWTLMLEFFMVIHGTTVAWFAIAGLEARWAQFLFGGLGVLLITQMHGVKLKFWHKFVITALSLAGAAWYYALHVEKLANLPNTVLSRYVAVVLLIGIIWLIMRPFIWAGKAVPGIQQQ